MKDQLGRTSSCIPLERLGEPLTTAEREHLAGCPRCEAELALAREFESVAMNDEEAGAVGSIVARLQAQPRATANVVSIETRRKGGGGRAFLAVAATVFLAFGLAWLVQSRRIRDDETGIDTTYRSLRVELLAPAGDVAAPPAELHWKAVAGTDVYDVALVEVDGTPLWNATTRSTRVALPRAVIAKLVPGKTVLWQVKARGRGQVLADSGAVKFRVVTQ